jgi:hypothetical protein
VTHTKVRVEHDAIDAIIRTFQGATFSERSLGKSLAPYTYLGAQFRRLRTKLGAPIATKAMAAKLTRLRLRPTKQCNVSSVCGLENGWIVPPVHGPRKAVVGLLAGD